MKLSIAEVKRRLSVGTEYTGEWIGPINTRVITNLGPSTMKPTNDRITRRVVRKQTGEMVSEFLTGPKTGQPIYGSWKGVVAREEDGSIILTNTETNEDYLKITL